METAMLSNTELIARLLLAAVLGSVVGADRERLVWAAGLRTHMLVCVGACLFMIVSAFGFADILGASHVILDPSRIAAQVVSGIGFLGAGSILLRGEVIRGLTTAASLWTVAAIGLAVGGGLYVAAMAATIIILVILAGLKPLEERFQGRNKSHQLMVEVERGNLSLAALDAALGYRARRVSRYVATPSETEGLEDIAITLTRLTPKDVEEIEQSLTALRGVRKVTRGGG
jgi:putative Mg2+ transporter-C (MgtC) family protein